MRRLSAVLVAVLVALGGSSGADALTAESSRPPDKKTHTSGIGQSPVPATPGHRAEDAYAQAEPTEDPPFEGDEEGDVAETDAAPSPTPLPEWSEEDAQRLQAIRDEVRALFSLQRVLQWYAVTKGEPVRLSETYLGREALFSVETLLFLDRALNRPQLEPEEAMALERLRLLVAQQYLELRASPFDDRLARAEREARVTVSWLAEPVGFRDIEDLAAEETDSRRLQELQAASARIFSEQINPLRAEREALLRGLAVEVGYGSYLELSERFRDQRIAPLIAQGTAFLVETDALFKSMLEQQTRVLFPTPIAGEPPLHRGLLNPPPWFRRYFPPGRELVMVEASLISLGLHAPGRALPWVVENAAVPYKDRRALVVPVRVPLDIRVSYFPKGGLRTFKDVMEVAGRAAWLSHIEATHYEFQYLGEGTLNEAWGRVFRLLWMDPYFLACFRTEMKKVGKGKIFGRPPVASPALLAAVARRGVLDELLHIRQTAFARLTYEAILHGAGPEQHQVAYDGSIEDLQAVYVHLLSRANGYPLTVEEALRFRVEAADFMGSADQARAALLAHQISEALRSRFGVRWFLDPAAGTFLKSLWADGTALTPDGLLERLRPDPLQAPATPALLIQTYADVRQRLERTLQEAELLERGELPPGPP